MRNVRQKLPTKLVCKPSGRPILAAYAKNFNNSALRVEFDPETGEEFVELRPNYRRKGWKLAEDVVGEDEAVRFAALLEQLARKPLKTDADFPKEADIPAPFRGHITSREERLADKAAQLDEGKDRTIAELEAKLAASEANAAKVAKLEGRVSRLLEAMGEDEDEDIEDDEEDAEDES